MTATVSEDWDDLVETLRSDLETVSSGSPEDEEVRTAIDEVWTIVDAAEDRIGPIDPDEVGEALGVDTDGDGNSIDVDSISREFVSEDPDRAAGLSRLVSLINLDDATDYDVGRLWVDEGEGNGETGGGDESSDVEDDSDAPPTDEEDSDHSMDGAGEELRSQLGDALSQFRDGIQDARKGIDGSSGDAESAGSDESDEDSDAESDGSSPSERQRSTSSNRSSTTFSTLPSGRRDRGSIGHFSTVPGRGGRSGGSSGSGGGRDDRSDIDVEE